MEKYYSKSISEILLYLKTTEEGLTEQEANSRLQQYGKNKLPESKPDNFFVIFFRQFKSPLIYILMGAGVLVFLLGEIIDSLVITTVLIFNAIVGAIQEGKAQNTLLALKNYTKTEANVIRDGKEMIIDDQDIVVGDIVILREGQKIPADARVIFSNNLKIDEAALTGESSSIHKINQVIKKNYLPVADQKNMLFMGTHVTTGSGKAVITATGINTEIGKIAQKIRTQDAQMPLKKNIKYLSRIIMAVVLAINVILLISGVILGRELKEIFVTIVALSVSIIPEGLPVVITLVLASGVWRMSKKNALIKRLQAVEALGQAHIIALDKTGTITNNEMVVQKIFVNDKLFDVDGQGYQPNGLIRLNNKIINPKKNLGLAFIGKNALLCTRAKIFISEQTKKWTAWGDPTEAAVVVAGEKIGWHKSKVEKEYPIIIDFPFDYKLKYRATLCGKGNKKRLIILGAPENILSISDFVWINGKKQKLTSERKLKLQSSLEAMSSNGLRVVAMGIKEQKINVLSPEKIKKITFAGFFGMKDILRPEIKETITRAQEAGLKILLITGDHKTTAISIAKEAGIFKENSDFVISGDELEKIDDKELLTIISRASVFARVSPEHKLRIINACKANKKIIAMTGDGVNDAPSLVAADLGIAMGKIGTEVAKEASDIIILDDNFNSIIAAIEEGRNIYKTIKKVILYLFSTSLGEVFTISSAIFLEWPLPILPSQIIWLNFVTDGFLTVAMGMEPKEKDLLFQKFSRSNKFFIDKLMIERMFLMACSMAIGSLIIFKGIFEYDLIKAQTMTLTVLAVFQWFNAFNCRSEEKSIFSANFFSNKFLIGATIIVITLQFAAIYVPILQKILRTVPLTIFEWLICIVLASFIVVLEETRKWILRKTNSNQA